MAGLVQIGSTEPKPRGTGEDRFLPTNLREARARGWDELDVVLVNGDPNPSRPDLPHYGAGEAACKPTLAAVANAIYDATGVRIRRVPFRDARVLAALKAASV